MDENLTPLKSMTDGSSTDASLVDETGALLQVLESKKPLPYLDIKGISAVGIGCNLHVSAGAYLFKRA